MKGKRTMSIYKTVLVRCHAFSSDGVRTHRVLIDGADVLVWDSVARHYTVMHVLSPGAVRRARQLAAVAS